MGELPSQKDLLVALADGHDAHLVAHAKLGDHAPGQRGRFLDVVAGASGDFFGSEDQLLGDASTKSDGQPAQQPLLGVTVPVLFGQRCHHAQ